jgi:hypothetical protein
MVASGDAELRSPVRRMLSSMRDVNYRGRHAAAAQLDVQNDMTFGAVKVVVLSFETLKQ